MTLPRMNARAAAIKRKVAKDLRQNTLRATERLQASGTQDALRGSNLFARLPMSLLLLRPANISKESDTKQSGSLMYKSMRN